MRDVCGEAGSRWRRCDADSGFTLPVVLWSLLLVSLLVTGFLATAHSNLRIAANAAGNAEADALAEAGLWLATFDLVTARRLPDHTPRFAVAGPPVSCQFPNGAILTIAIEDEAGKIDVNQADDRLLVRLLIGLGSSRADASRMADRIIDYRDADGLRRLNGAEADEYRKAGRPDGPANAPLVAITELGQVLGISEPMLDRLYPLVTVDSASPGIDPAVAPPALQDALSLTPSAALLGASRADAAGTLPELPLVRSRGDVLTIWSALLLPDGSRAELAAVVALSAQRNRSYVVRRWLRHPDRSQDFGQDVRGARPVRSIGGC